MLRLLFSALWIAILAYFLPGLKVDGVWDAILLSVVMSVLNFLVRPVLTLLTLPLTILTLGLFLLVINVIIVYIADALLSGFHVSNFLSALIFGLLVSGGLSLGGSKKD